MIRRTFWTRILALPLLASWADRGQATDWSEPMPRVASSLLTDAAVHGSRAIAVGERGHVLLSQDRGANWQQVEVPTRSTLTAVWIAGRDRAWIVGHGGLILRSADGGRSWARQRWSEEPDRPLLDVWFADLDYGIAIGAYGLMVSTEDGGNTWREHLSDKDAAHLNVITEASDGTLYIAGEFGSLLRSDDRGRSWQRLQSPYEGSFFCMLALHGDTILVCGLRGHLFRSEDRGTTWQRVATGTTATLLAGVEQADGIVVLGGLGGVLLSSDDGGRQFRLRHRPDRHGIAALIELDPDQLLAVGEGGLTRISVRGLEIKPGAMVDSR